MPFPQKKKKNILLPKKVSILLNLFKREEDQQALEVVLLKYGTRQKTVLSYWEREPRIRIEDSRRKILNSSF